MELDLGNVPDWLGLLPVAGALLLAWMERSRAVRAETRASTEAQKLERDAAKELDRAVTLAIKATTKHFNDLSQLVVTSNVVEAPEWRLQMQGTLDTCNALRAIPSLPVALKVLTTTMAGTAEAALTKRPINLREHVEQILDRFRHYDDVMRHRYPDLRSGSR